MGKLLSNGQVVAGNARSRGMGGVTFDAKVRSATSPAVGTGTSNIIDGTLYLSKLEDPYPYTTISAVGRVFTTAFGAGSTGATAPSLCALAVYWSNGSVLTQLGTVDLVSLSSYAAGPVVHTQTTGGGGHPIAWTLPSVGLTVYVGFVVNLPYVTGSTGAVRTPSGQGSPNDWLTTGTDELVFAIGATGITTLAGIPASINVSAFSTTNLPLGPFLFGLKP